MEAAIACIVIGMFLIFIVEGFSIDPQPMDVSESAYNILKGLDDRGALRNHAVSMDYGSINSEINKASLAGYNHTVQVCDDVGQCAGSAPSGVDDVWVGSYFIAGKTVYRPVEIKLYLWEI